MLNLSRVFFVLDVAFQVTHLHLFFVLRISDAYALQIDHVYAHVFSPLFFLVFYLASFL